MVEAKGKGGRPVMYALSAGMIRKKSGTTDRQL